MCTAPTAGGVDETAVKSFRRVLPVTRYRYGVAFARYVRASKAGLAGFFTPG